MIRIEHLKKSFAESTPLQDVNAVINDGDVISVIGPSGCGKSTLLRCINMLSKPTAGRTWVNDTEITAPGCDLRKIRQKMGMVFQSFNLFGHLTVIENTMYAPMKLLGKSAQEAYDEGLRLLKQVGMADRANRYPDALSGGQKQRVAIARTLAMDPDIILLDEPTSALDPTMVGEVQAVIKNLSQSGKTMLIVTHEMDFARAICNRVFYMDEGGLYEDGTPEQIFEHPQKEKTRRFIQRLKVLTLEIDTPRFDFFEADEKLADYCDRHHMSARLKYHVLLILEELVKEILLPAQTTPRILFTAEYNPAAESTAVDVDYDGPPVDLESSKNVFSWPVLKAAASEVSIVSDGSNGYANRVHIVLN